jgi:hypothetical protein
MNSAMTDLQDFQRLQVSLVEGGFDTTLQAHREADQAVFSLSVALHHEQTPEVMTKLTDIVAGHGLSFTAEDETVRIAVPDPSGV